jgi:hypothetical protein
MRRLFVWLVLLVAPPPTESIFACFNATATNSSCCTGPGDGFLEPPRPALFITGAVKAGTSALHHNLHRVFHMPSAKELYHFNNDGAPSLAQVFWLRVYLYSS